MIGWLVANVHLTKWTLQIRTSFGNVNNRNNQTSSLRDGIPNIVTRFHYSILGHPIFRLFCIIGILVSLFTKPTHVQNILSKVLLCKDVFPYFFTLLEVRQSSNHFIDRPSFQKCPKKCPKISNKYSTSGVMKSVLIVPVTMVEKK